MTQTNQSDWKGGRLLPSDITRPENVKKLRELTTELEMRIERALRSLFANSVMPWEQWFINAIANPDNRAALGIPNNLEKVEMSHLLGGREGFHETFRRTNLERLGIIIAESLRTIVSNPLAGAGLTPFKDTIETLSNELLRELRWNEFDNKLQEKLQEKLEDESHKSTTPSWGAIEQLTFGFWHSYLDPAMNVVLDTLTRSRYDESILNRSQIKNVIKQIVDGYNKTNSVNSCLSLIWLLSVIVFSSSSDDDEILKNLDTILGKGEHVSENDENDKETHLTDSEPYLHNKKDMIESLGVLQEFKDKKYIRQVIAIPAALEIVAYLGKFNDGDNDTKKYKNLGGLKSKLSNLICYVLNVDNYPHNGKMPLKESDWGHLYFMCNKLDALYSFWIWYYADLLTHEEHTLLKIGKYWYSETVYDLTEFIHKQKSSFMKKCPDSRKENDCKELWKTHQRVKGVQHSVFMMGGAGFGKTELIKQIYTTEDNNGIIPWEMIQLTPLSFSKSRNVHDILAERINGKNKNNGGTNDYNYDICVVFVDELHLDTQPSIYALLLVPLGEGVKNETRTGEEIIKQCNCSYNDCEWKKNNELNIHFVFASSRYQTKREFLEEAFITKNTAMRDFATRIKHWIELPGFSLVPEQKLALFSEDLLKNKKVQVEVKDKDKITYKSDIIKKRKNMIKKFLDLQITSTREFIKTSDTDINNRLWGLNNVVRQNSYPKWLWNHFGI